MLKWQKWGAAFLSVRPSGGRPTKKRVDEEGKKSFEVTLA